MIKHIKYIEKHIKHIKENEVFFKIKKIKNKKKIMGKKYQIY